jgi:molecular chaperone GrpE
VTHPSESNEEAPPTPEEAPEEAPSAEPEIAEPTLEEQLAERTADLQRLQAEYVNYRKRVERDRAAARGQGEIAVLRSLLTVLDDIGRAEEERGPAMGQASRWAGRATGAGRRKK